MALREELVWPGGVHKCEQGRSAGLCGGERSHYTSLEERLGVRGLLGDSCCPLPVSSG